MIRSFALLCLLLMTFVDIFTQEPHLKATRVSTPPVLDGRLDDQIWQLAKPYTRFYMVEPNPGQAPTEQTAIRIIYDSKGLYIGINCYDNDPSKIVANSMIHDDPETRDEDKISILLDPFQDKRSGYLFIVNPNGARSEGYSQGEHYSLDWNGIWDARCRKTSSGWVAEIYIPFKTISFNPHLSSWGINVERYIARKQESDRISGIALNKFFTNPVEAALLEDIDSIKQGLGLTIRPYGIAGGYWGNDSLATRKKLDGGFDIYKNITPNLVTAITYNTDFAETEVDDRQLNLTRFPLYYPEKRTFFLEGSDIFDFGTSSSSSFIPFFSRTIGLYHGSPVPLKLGAKLFGKLGNTNIAALDVQTGAKEILPSTNLFAARVSQNIFKQSKVGMILTNGSPEGFQNTLAGADFNFVTSRLMNKFNFSLIGWGFYNFNMAKSGRKDAYGMKIDFPNDLIDASVIYNYFSDSINPALGFLPRKSFHYFRTGFAYQPRPRKGYFAGKVRQFFFEFEMENYWNLNGELESRSIFTAPLNLRTESGEHIEFNIIPNKEILPVDFEVAQGVIIPRSAYNFLNYRIELNTASFRKIQFDWSYRFGQFYNGHYKDLETGITFKLNGIAVLGVMTNLVKGDLPAGRFSENVLQVKFDLHLTPDLGLTSYVQYDNVSGQVGYNGKFYWQIKPGNIIYLVYNDNWIRQWDPQSRFVNSEQKLIFKVQLNFRI